MTQPTPMEILKVAADQVEDVTGEKYAVSVMRSGLRVVGFALNLRDRAWVVRDSHGAYLAVNIVQGRSGAYRRGWRWVSSLAEAHKFGRRRDAKSVRLATNSRDEGRPPRSFGENSWRTEQARRDFFRIEEVS